MAKPILALTDYDQHNPKSQLELFLLSGMRNTLGVEAAMARLGVTSEEVALARDAVMSATTGDVPIHPLSFFLTDIEPDGEEMVPSTKYGDRRRQLTLETWPDMHYAYLVRPDGISTSPEFVCSDPDRPNLETTYDGLRPWTVTRRDVERWFGPPLLVDEWEFDAGLNYNLREQSGAKATLHRLDFDHNLLQVVRSI